MRLFVLISVCLSSYAADLCSRNDVQGPYGFQLAGSSTISGAPTPSATVGRLVFGSDGTLSGFASVNFNGYFLGNPVSGNWDMQGDCSMTWSLQDDSGAWQHFLGKTSPGGANVTFHQTDAGTGGAGAMKKTPALCDAGSFSGQYALTLTGNSTPFAGGAPKSLSAMLVADADGAGGLNLLQEKGKTTGSYEVNSDCFMEIHFALPLPDGTAGPAVRLRGILVNDGREALAIQTDPKNVSAAKFSR